MMNNKIHLEISDRQTGKTTRLIDQIVGTLTHKKYNFRFKPASPNIEQKYLIVSNKNKQSNHIMKRIPKEFHEYVVTGTYHNLTNAVCGEIFDKIFFDEFDYFEKNDWFDPSILLTLVKSQLYFTTSLAEDITLEKILEFLQELGGYNPEHQISETNKLNSNPIYYLLYMMDWKYLTYERNHEQYEHIDYQEEKMIYKNLLKSVIKENSQRIHMRKVEKYEDSGIL